MSAPERGAAWERRSGAEPQPGEPSPLQVIGQLAGGIAHDFNNILGVIINYARFASGSVPADSPAHADIEEIRRAAERGVGLVRQLMILARRETGAERRLRPQRADRRASTASCARRSASTSASSGGCSRELWPIAEDPARIEQILINLAVNARDAMPGGGTLSFETEQRRARAERDAGCSRASSRGASFGCWSPTPGSAWTARSPRARSSRCSPRRRRARAPASAWRPSTRSSPRPAGSIDLSSEPGTGTSIEIHLPGQQRGTPRRRRARPARRRRDAASRS